MEAKLKEENPAHVDVSTPYVKKGVCILTPPSSGRIKRVTNFHSVDELATPSGMLVPSILQYSPISDDENSSTISEHTSNHFKELFSSPALQISARTKDDHRTKQPLKASAPSDREILPEGNQGNHKKNRTIYKTQQVYVLEQVFRENQYPESEVMERLARELCITETKVKIWFQNKRARWRRREVETSKLYQNTQLYLASQAKSHINERLHNAFIQPNMVPQQPLHVIPQIPQATPPVFVTHKHSFMNNNLYEENSRNYDHSLTPSGLVSQINSRPDHYLSSFGLGGQYPHDVSFR